MHARRTAGPSCVRSCMRRACSSTPDPLRVYTCTSVPPPDGSALKPPAAVLLPACPQPAALRHPAKMNFTDVEQALVVTEVLSGLGCSAGNLRDCIPAPSTSLIVATGGALAIGYAMWEQSKFWMYRQTKKGPMPGEPASRRQCKAVLPRPLPVGELTSPCVTASRGRRRQPALTHNAQGAAGSSCSRGNRGARQAPLPPPCKALAAHSRWGPGPAVCGRTHRMCTRRTCIVCGLCHKQPATPLPSMCPAGPLPLRRQALQCARIRCMHTSVVKPPCPRAAPTHNRLPAPHIPACTSGPAMPHASCGHPRTPASPTARPPQPHKPPG